MCIRDRKKILVAREFSLQRQVISSTEECYLDRNIKKGGTNTSFRISIYDKRENFTFRIVNFPHMDSNIPSNPAYGVYISQLVTSWIDCGRSLRLRQQGFVTNLPQKSLNKFFTQHVFIVTKYDATLREMRLAIQAWIAPSHPYITYLLLRLFFQLYLGTCACALLFCARALLINLIDVFI